MASELSSLGNLLGVEGCYNDTRLPCCGNEVYTVQGLTAVGDLVTDAIVRVTSSVRILVVKW